MNQIETILWWLSSAGKDDVESIWMELYELLIQHPEACNFLPGFPSKDHISSKFRNYTPKQVLYGQVMEFLRENDSKPEAMEARVQYALSVWERIRQEIRQRRPGTLWLTLWLATYLVIHPNILRDPKFEEAKKWMYESFSSYRQNAPVDHPDKKTYMKILDTTGKFLKLAMPQFAVWNNDISRRSSQVSGPPTDASNKSQTHAVVHLLTGKKPSGSRSSLESSNHLSNLKCTSETREEICKTKGCKWNRLTQQCMIPDDFVLQVLQEKKAAIPMANLRKSSHLKDVNCKAQTSQERCIREKCIWNDEKRQCMSRRMKPSRHVNQEGSRTPLEEVVENEDEDA